MSCLAHLVAGLIASLLIENFSLYCHFKYSKTCLKQPLKKTKNWFSRRILLNAGQKYCRMFQGEHSAILSTFIKSTFVLKSFALSIFEWPPKDRFYCSTVTVVNYCVTSDFRSKTTSPLLHV